MLNLILLPRLETQKNGDNDGVVTFASANLPGGWKNQPVEGTTHFEEPHDPDVWEAIQNEIDPNYVVNPIFEIKDCLLW